MNEVTAIFRHDELTGLNIKITQLDRDMERFYKDTRVKQLMEQLNYGLVSPIEYAHAILVIGSEYNVV